MEDAMVRQLLMDSCWVGCGCVDVDADESKWKSWGGVGERFK